MYNSMRSLLLSSILISTAFSSVCGGNIHVASYNCSSPVCQGSADINYDYSSYSDQFYTDLLYRFDEGIVALHIFKNELKNKYEEELFYWLGTLLSGIKFTNGTYGIHAYHETSYELLQYIMQRIDAEISINDKIACLKAIKLQRDLDSLKYEVKHQKHQIKHLKHQVNTTFFDRAKRTLNDYAPEIFISTVYVAVAGMMWVHRDRMSPPGLELVKSVEDFLAAAASKTWNVAKALCPYTLLAAL